MERTIIDGQSVILTAGGLVQNTAGEWEQCFGMFATEEDARSVEADRLVVGTIGRNNLTPEQIVVGERNNESY